MTRPDELSDFIKSEASRLGFLLSGICPAVAPTGVSRLAEWLDRGYAGQMEYLAARQEAYSHPRHVLDGVRSIVMLGLPYSTIEPRLPQPGEGRISRYAWGEGDYHDLIHDKLRALIAAIRALAPAAKSRGVVDTAPLLEREFAQLAGLGWVGKHTLLINKPLGSYFFLAALLTDLELVYDEPFTADHCGSCRACLDACPTNAFPQPYVLDASRCISYLTIELRDHIPADLREGIGDWLFGCDICQEVCPWNHRAPTNDEPVFQPAADTNPIDLAALFDLDDDAFRRRFRHTPLWRARRRGILRNAAIILGNQRALAALPALIRGLHDSEPLIRAASAWALAQLNSLESPAALAARLEIEPDAAVHRAIEEALAPRSANVPSTQARPGA
jgi:epoxyqueuosine reductase